MNKIVYGLSVLSIILFISCKKNVQNNYPIEPHIELKNVVFTRGVDLAENSGVYIILSLDYTDGDSDIGRKICENCLDDYNCVTTFYKKIDGVFNLIENGLLHNPAYLFIKEISEPNHVYNMGPITVKTRTPYEGELQIKLFAFDVSNPFKIGDIIKITVQIIDENKNRSNIVEIEKVYAY